MLARQTRDRIDASLGFDGSTIELSSNTDNINFTQIRKSIATGRDNTGIYPKIKTIICLSNLTQFTRINFLIKKYTKDFNMKIRIYCDEIDSYASNDLFGLLKDYYEHDENVNFTGLTATDGNPDIWGGGTLQYKRIETLNGDEYSGVRHLNMMYLDEIEYNGKKINKRTPTDTVVEQTIKVDGLYTGDGKSKKFLVFPPTQTKHHNTIAEKLQGMGIATLIVNGKNRFVLKQDGFPPTLLEQSYKGENLSEILPKIITDNNITEPFAFIASKLMLSRGVTHISRDFVYDTCIFPRPPNKADDGYQAVARCAHNFKTTHKQITLWCWKQECNKYLQIDKKPQAVQDVISTKGHGEMDYETSCNLVPPSKKADKYSECYRPVTILDYGEFTSHDKIRKYLKDYLANTEYRDFEMHSWKVTNQQQYDKYGIEKLINTKMSQPTNVSNKDKNSIYSYYYNGQLIICPWAAKKNNTVD